MTVNQTNISLFPNNSENDQLELEKWVATNQGFFEILLDAFCVVNNKNEVIEFNEAFSELSGISFRQIKKTPAFCGLITTELCPSQCPAFQIINSQQSIRLDELKGHSKAFPALHLILSGLPVFSTDRKRVVGAMLNIRNVTAESELQKKYDERKRDSITDGLTRLYNKVYTETVLIKLLKGSQRDSLPLSIVMCDIDHFKQVNDKFGHQAGDYVLATVAQMLKGESRETDIIGRFGGEEFIAVLYNTDQAGAKIFSERFRQRVEKTQVLFERKHIPVTVSLGSCTFKQPWTNVFSADKTAKDLISNADTALYLAKANGRNKTWQFENISKKLLP